MFLWTHYLSNQRFHSTIQYDCFVLRLQWHHRFLSWIIYLIKHTWIPGNSYEPIVCFKFNNFVSPPAHKTLLGTVSCMVWFGLLWSESSLCWCNSFLTQKVFHCKHVYVKWGPHIFSQWSILELNFELEEVVRALSTLTPIKRSQKDKFVDLVQISLQELWKNLWWIMNVDKNWHFLLQEGMRQESS